MEEGEHFKIKHELRKEIKVIQCLQNMASNVRSYVCVLEISSYKFIFKKRMQIHLRVMAVEPYQQGCQCCLVPDCITAKADTHTLDPGSTSYS